MCILKQHEDRLTAAQLFDATDERLERLLFSALRTEVAMQ
jgi:hypothetical protein